MQALLATAEQEAERLRAEGRAEGPATWPPAAVGSRRSCTASPTDCAKTWPPPSATPRSSRRGHRLVASGRGRRRPHPRRRRGGLARDDRHGRGRRQPRPRASTAAARRRPSRAPACCASRSPTRSSATSRPPRTSCGRPARRPPSTSQRRAPRPTSCAARPAPSSTTPAPRPPSSPSAATRSPQSSRGSPASSRPWPSPLTCLATHPAMGPTDSAPEEKEAPR